MKSVRGIVTAAALLLSVSVSAEWVIDDFEDAFLAAGSVNGNVGEVKATGSGNKACGYALESSGNILGGERDVSIDVRDGTGAVTVTTKSSGEKRLSVSMDDATSGDVSIKWDGTQEVKSATAVCSTTYTGLNSLNLTENGGSKFRLMVYTSDNNVGNIIIKVYTSETRVSSYSMTLEFLGTQGPGKTYEIPFSSFSGNANFQNVGAIELKIEGAAPSLDLSFGWHGWVVTPVAYNDAFDRVKKVEDGVAICWETTMEQNVEGFFYGQCPQNMQDCVIQYIDAKGLDNGAPYCETIPGLSMKNGDQYGVVNVDRDFTAGDIHWITP